MLNDELLEQFIQSGDTLWVYKEMAPIFQSRKERLASLLDYIDTFVPRIKGATMFDRIVGNAAALLLKKALCHQVYSPVASEMAVRSLEKFDINYHFSEVVPFILEENGICPLEKLSVGKTPDEFYRAVKDLTPGV